MTDRITVWQCPHCLSELEHAKPPATCPWCLKEGEFANVTEAALERLAQHQEAERQRSLATNQAIALGRVVVDYDPLRLLSQLRAQVSWIGGHGYVIVLGKSHDDHWFKRLVDVLEFHGSR